MKKSLVLLRILGILLVFGMTIIGCASGPKVTRLDSGADTDLTGYWSANDVDAVCADLINQFLESPRVARFEAANGRLPVIRVGTFKNSSSEPIDTTIVSKRMQVQILNSGKADFVADSGVSEELRAEAADQQAHATEDSAAALDEETGADFLLTGAVKTIIQTAGNQQTRFYDVTADATDITTHRIIWSGENDEIRKRVVRPKSKI
jgi:PBP1b-binding outer membrane lipoprotein LpoB